jgi:hypothetical protein
MAKEKYYLVMSVYNEPEGTTIEACDAESAAEAYAEWSDNHGDYEIAGGNAIDLTVIGPCGTVSKFRVSGRTTTIYIASERNE